MDVPVIVPVMHMAIDIIRPWRIRNMRATTLPSNPQLLQCKFPMLIISRTMSRSYSANISSLARCAALTTALIKVTRNLPSSSSRMPSMVHPAGVVTSSFSNAG